MLVLAASVGLGGRTIVRGGKKGKREKGEEREEKERRGKRREKEREGSYSHNIILLHTCTQLPMVQSTIEFKVDQCDAAAGAITCQGRGEPPPPTVH